MCAKKANLVEQTVTVVETPIVEEAKPVTPNDPGWTAYVLSLLEEDEKKNDNPTVDGLRRIFETALNCRIASSQSRVVAAPSRENEHRATVEHQIAYILNDGSQQTVVVNGVADAYWGNCPENFKMYATAMADTRAEGRALRRALKLRKVVAEEISDSVDTTVDGESLGRITSNQLNFFKTIGSRMNINIQKVLEKLDIVSPDIYKMSYDDALKAVKFITECQQKNQVPEELVGYDPNWR